MRLLPVLFLLISQAHFSTCVMRMATGRALGTLTVHCTYGRGWEPYKKWWCRGYDWDSCKILVKSTGSEQLVKKGRVSIQDSHSQRIFTVTLEDLWYDDADTYWCGIEKVGNDLGYKVYVDVDPALDPTDPPQTVATTKPASRASSRPFTQGINSSQPTVLTNPHSRSGNLVFNVAAQNPPVWILRVLPLLMTLKWLCQG